MTLQPFRLGVPLTAGPMLVQASAGTGKTWSIARLVARLLVEDGPSGTPPPTIRQVLVVTFTEAATAELRDRIRALLVLAAETAEQLVRDWASGGPIAPPSEADGLGVLLGSGSGAGWQAFSAAELERRLGLLRAAIVDFDTAAISTIHGFCQRLLQELAFESGAPFGEEVLKDVTPLVEDLLDDWMAQRLVNADLPLYRWLVDSAGGGLTRPALREIALAAVRNPEATLQPAPPALAANREPFEALSALVEGVWRPQWQEQGAELVGFLQGSDRFNKKKLNKAHLRKSAEAVQAWLESGCAEPLGDNKLRWSKLSELALGDDASDLLPPIAMALDSWEQARSTLSYRDRVCLAGWIRTALAERLKSTQQLTFDDMLRRVRDGLLRNGEAGAAFVAALRHKFHVALIDEFQDTDAVQWAIFERIFCGTSTHRLVLIGDPKQAIYSFRGADIAVYERARSTVPAERQYSMTRNFRSDARLVDACNVAMSGTPSLFLTESIQYERVQAAQPPARLFGRDGQPLPPLVVRWVGDKDGKIATGNYLTGEAREDAAKQIKRLLGAGAQVGSSADRRRPLRAGDIAVLVSVNRSAREMRSKLIELGVPAVLSQAGSVFDGEEAWWLQLWLQALAAPTDVRALRAFAATLPGGVPGQVLIAAQEGEAAASAVWEAYVRAIQQQAKRFASAGLASAFSLLLQMSAPAGAGDGTESPQSALQRLVAHPMGERLLTNLRHLAELLTAAQLAERMTADALSRWLQRQRKEAEDDVDAGQLRLESDADAVVISTLHKSKGLQYPIVFLPDLMLDKPIGGFNPGKNPFRFHPKENPAELVLDIRGLAASDESAKKAAWYEAQQERQRLLYVAITRAEWQVVVYAGPVKDNQIAKLGERHFLRSPVGLLMQEPNRHENRVAAAPEAPDGTAFAVVQAFAERVNETCGTELCVVQDSGQSEPAGEMPDPVAKKWLDVANLHGWSPDDLWRTESYTGLIASRHGSKLADEDRAVQPSPPDEKPGDDEEQDDLELLPVKLIVPNPPESADLVERGARAVDLRLFPGGADAGKWVHEVLEHLHFASSPPRPKDAALGVAQLIRRHGARHGFGLREVQLPPIEDREPGASELSALQTVSIDQLLIDALPTILLTPLGAAAGNLRLADLADHERLDELKFDLPVGSSAPRVDVFGQDLAQALASRNDGFALPGRYLQHLKQMGFRTLRGYLTGTIDLVFCAPVDGRRRWFVVDYKTNLLGPTENQKVSRSQPQHYTRPWLEAEVARKHYYVQYVLYLTALHRFLQLRLADYDYDTHMGGALYLFVRGMPGKAANPEACASNRVPGVFFDRPPKALIERLSSVLAGLHPTTAEAV